ncbi:hypothetical protein CAP31_05630 [Sulfuriferula sp. AH1]|uniref:tetratricopeptide repeat-containing glycosyltransferase family protein n=1 Tax=Sulfuriferula sp. AH1 TaxID=1985873 RepID=UPI000B3B9859|nr:tetratricopeptide repeat-containing glycosyltransferase family protein [Sulfuriferula sp. AH1]ARU31213.1 hypothetical protein CAP31_05630 [Sulfuriferula sp. AH1]
MTTDTSSSQTMSQATEKTLNQAIALHQAAKLEEAEALYRDILQTLPTHPEANHNLGVLTLQTGEPAASLAFFVVALDADPANGRYWVSYIDALCRAGQFDEARQILALAQQHGLQGEDVDALALRLNDGPASSAQSPDTQDAHVKKPAGQKSHGPAQQEIDTLVTLFNSGRLDETIALARTLTEHYPQHDFGWKALGAAFKQMGRSADALVPMQKAAALSSNDAEAHNNLGITLNDLKRHEEAEASYRRAIRINPSFAQAHSNLGVTLHDLNRLDEAVTCYRTALKLNPDYVRAHNNLGAALHDLRRLDEAEACYRKVLRLSPEHADAHRNLGATLHDLDRLDEAEACYREALQLNPRDADAYNYLGITLRDLGRLSDSETAFRRALEINPRCADTRHNLSHTLLTLGKLAEAWQEYEYRWDAKAIKTMQRPVTVLPQWTGQTPLSTDRLLIFNEQGMGDKIQFSRYLTLAAKRFPGGISIVTVAPLLTLFRRSFPDIEIIDAVPADQTAWQWQCPLLSLPLAMGTRLESIPNQVPYLIPDPIRMSYWQSKIAALDLPASTRKIGVVWKPGSKMKNAALRALALQQIFPLLNLSGCSWFSLQKEPDPDKASRIASGKLIDWSDEFNDFDDTAALAAKLDLIISVDTAVAHLAGSLGQPTWLLNRHAGEWRWLRERTDSPWYPTMRIFTQSRSGDWESVIRQLCDALRNAS